MTLVHRTLIALLALAPAAVAQSDSRWQAWLGCWTADSARAPAASAVCVVPVAKSNAVELLTISRGAVVIRERVEANGRPQTIDGNGCSGTETANWSASGRRVYLHADFSCANRTPGTTTTVFSMMPTGEWLRVEKARADGGSVLTATRLRPTSIPAALSELSARSIESQQRAITTARASAAAPIVANEILDAVNNLDGDVVRAWLVASQQQFDFDAAQITALANAGVPSPILEAVGAVRAEPQTVASQQPAVVDENPPEMRTMRVCPPSGCSNRYSEYNGADWGAAPPYQYPYPYNGYLNNGYPYPYPYVYPYTGFVPFTSVVTTNARNKARNIHDRAKSFNGGHPGGQYTPRPIPGKRGAAPAPAPRRR